MNHVKTLKWDKKKKNMKFELNWLLLWSTERTTPKNMHMLCVPFSVVRFDKNRRLIYSQHIDLQLLCSVHTLFKVCTIISLLVYPRFHFICFLSFEPKKKNSNHTFACIMNEFCSKIAVIHSRSSLCVYVFFIADNALYLRCILLVAADILFMKF